MIFWLIFFVFRKQIQSPTLGPGPPPLELAREPSMGMHTSDHHCMSYSTTGTGTQDR